MAFWNNFLCLLRYLYESPNTKWYLAIFLGCAAYMGRAAMDYEARRRAKADRDGRRSRYGE
ncbi:MAG: hypothetical protein LBF24_03895 [Puniceicoccales bacterium]|jgi:hypothetical protein|nr:hypothetical protein [Puniceicoccales bacterium]